MISDPVFSVTEDGISAPQYSEILEYLQEKARGIFGSDIVLTADSQDGQLLAIFALALHDVNSQAVAVYSSYNPQSAIGAALDGAVKTNGLTRRVATHSVVDLTLVGRAGAVITNGVASDTLGQNWLLPASVTIPVSGEIIATATAENAGAVQAAANTITTIATPTFGWQTVTNAAPATPGVAVETDAELRAQQAVSTAAPSVSLWEGIRSSVLALPGVIAVSGKKNDTGVEDDDGIPGHSVALVVEGGDADEIGATIYLKKGEGTGTFGSTTVIYTDTYGFPNNINFSRPTQADISVEITIRPTATYVTAADEDIALRIVDYINSLNIGDSVNIARVLASAVKNSEAEIDERFTVENITLGKNGGAQATASIALDWREVAVCDFSDVTVTVLNV